MGINVVLILLILTSPFITDVLKNAQASRLSTGQGAQCWRRACMPACLAWQIPCTMALVLLAAAAKKREMDDNGKKLGQLLWRLNAGEVSEGVVPKLLQLCTAIDAADWHTANHIQVCTGLIVHLLAVLWAS